MKYLQDMDLMTLNVMDQHTQELQGFVKINPKMHLQKDSHKSIQYNLDIADTFPIINSSGQQIG